MIATCGYDAGNNRSVGKALLYPGQETVINRDPKIILESDGVILPGVGAFGDAMGKFHTQIFGCTKEE